MTFSTAATSLLQTACTIAILTFLAVFRSQRISCERFCHCLLQCYSWGRHLIDGAKGCSSLAEQLGSTLVGGVLLTAMWLEKVWQWVREEREGLMAVVEAEKSLSVSMYGAESNV